MRVSLVCLTFLFIRLQYEIKNSIHFIYYVKIVNAVLFSILDEVEATFRF
jgi:hypothetical protein